MIVFVAIGRPPRHVGHAIAQARRADRDASIVLLHDDAREPLRSIARAHRVDCVDIAPLRRDERLSAFYRRPDGRRRFRRGFWQHTTGRFFVLRAFMDREHVDRATHLEHDVLLYAPERAIDRGAQALATVFENSTRAVPGIVHVGGRPALDRFVDGILAEDAARARHTTDMERFAAARRSTPGLVVDLPTLPSHDGGGSHHTRSLFDDGAVRFEDDGPAWLFDGARFGQYLGGIDPRNERSRLVRWFGRQHGTLGQPNGFVNESCLDDPSQYRYGVTVHMGLSVPAVIVGARSHPLATLHVHSKRLDRFVSPALDRQREGAAASC